MLTDPRIERLKLYRLQADLSYEQLALQMRAAGFQIRTRALHLALTGRLQTSPRETTLYKYGAFVERMTRTKKTALATTQPTTTKRKKPRRAAA